MMAWYEREEEFLSISQGGSGLRGRRRKVDLRRGRRGAKIPFLCGGTQLKLSLVHLRKLTESKTSNVRSAVPTGQADVDPASLLRLWRRTRHWAAQKFMCLTAKGKRLECRHDKGEETPGNWAKPSGGEKPSRVASLW